MGRKPPKRTTVRSSYAPPGRAKTTFPVLLVIAIALFVLTRIYILWFFQPLISDVGMYFGYAARAIDLHQTPYMEDFEVPYPPLALWTVCAPRLIDQHAITRPQDPSQVTPIFYDYRQAFRGLMFVCDLTSFIMLLLIVRKRCPRLQGWAALFYVITSAVLGHLLYDRLDVALLMLLMLGLYCWMRSLEESPWPISWATLAYMILGLGISFKIIPVICIPFLLLSDFHAPHRLERLAYALMVLAAGICIPFIIQYFATGPGVFDIFKFHAERVVHLESLYSTLMMIASLFGPRAFVSHSHGAFDLSGDLSNAMITLSKILLGGFLAGTGIWALLRWSRFSREDAYRLTCYVIPTSVILAIVLSPQYFVWAFPILLLLAVEIIPEGRASPWILGVLLIVVGAMTIWVFPYNFGSTIENPHALVPMPLTDHLDPSALTAYIVLGLRNFIYLGVVVWMGVMLFKYIYRAEAPNSSNLSGSIVK